MRDKATEGSALGFTLPESVLYSFVLVDTLCQLSESERIRFSAHGHQFEDCRCI